MFDKDWQSLNESQKEAITTIEENSLVLAPAGTGKTKVIAMRTAYLMRQGVNPSKILCLTFTNKAAKEMEERIGGYNPLAIKEITIKTFHAFCYHLIGLEKAASHFSFPCTIVDEADSQEILQKICLHILPQVEMDYGMLLGFIENVKRFSLECSRDARYDYEAVVKDFVKVGLIENKVLSEYGGQILYLYQKYLKQNNSVDFMDLIVEATYLLEDPEILRRWQDYYEYIQVDEVQDTSKREYQIIKWLGEKHRVSFFGDFNQTIYEWRGSQPREMLADFRETFLPKEINLNCNYRSTQMLLKAANNFIKNSLQEPSICEAMVREIGSPIEVIRASSKQQELIGLAKSIRGHHMSELGETAVLTRTNGYAGEIYKVLTAYGIPCIKVDSIRLFRKPEVKSVLAFFHYSINKRNNLALERILNQPIIGMENWLLTELKKTKKCYMGLGDWMSTETADPYQPLFRAYEKNEIVVLDVESTGLDTTIDEVIQIAAIRYGKDGVSETLDVLLKPTRSVGTSQDVHGFSDERLAREGIDPEEALEKLNHFATGAIIVGHNVQYDLDILQSMYYRYNQEYFMPKHIFDTLDLARKIVPNLKDHKLGTLAKLIQTEATPNHNALYDILATAEVMVFLMQKLNARAAERLDAIEQYFPYVMPYKSRVESIIDTIQSQAPYESLEYLMNDCGLKEGLEKEALGNLRELYRVMKGLYDESYSIYDNVIKLLTFTALHHSEIEQSDLFKNKIPIITVHQAKGLEFENVYIAGCNEGLFPLRRSMNSGYLQEEKRLFYVAMTRARSKLYISYDSSRKGSYFIEDIGEDFKKYSQIP